MCWAESFAKTGLRYDPLDALLGSGNGALIFHAKRDLIGKEDLDHSQLWELPEAASIVRKQKPDGSWTYPGRLKDHRDEAGYNQLETFRQVGFLIEKYAFTRRHPAIRKAADYLFSCQTPGGDFRGIYGVQYATTYSPMITELLIKAGYSDDPRVVKSLEWLIDMRQLDGGWAIPLRTVKASFVDVLFDDVPIEPDRTKPFSHLITGCVLRALAFILPMRRPRLNSPGSCC